jgi:hypothetical protein
MLVKADKPNSCYTYTDYLDNLKQMKASDLAVALKCSPSELNCETAYELLYTAVTRFKSIIGYRELIATNETVESARVLKQSAIVLLDPIKKINEHHFTYSLTQLKRNPKAKMNYKKAFR